MAQTKRDRIPRGIVLIATLLMIGAFFVGGIGLLVPTQTLTTFNLPRSLLLVGALVVGVLVYGLLRMRRWAWGATLSFVFVNAYFILLQARLTGAGQYVGLAILLLIAIYLFTPGVRAVFLRPRDS